MLPEEKVIVEALRKIVLSHVSQFENFHKFASTVGQSFEEVKVSTHSIVDAISDLAKLVERLTTRIESLEQQQTEHVRFN